MKPLNQELSEIATTPQLERIAHELKVTHVHLKRNLEVLANFERNSINILFYWNQLIKAKSLKN